VFNYDLGQVDRHDPERNKYDIFTVSDLQTMLKKQHIELPDNSLNRRHLIRALERGGINRSRLDRPVENTIIVGITTEKQIIQDRIRKRSIAMLDNGLAQEVRNLVEKYGQECEPIRRNLYGVIQEYLNGKIQTEGDLIQKMVIIDRRLAKKQLTWWRKNQFIEWMDSDEVISYIMDKTNLSK
jgi:tRNA dimethylallyltransferase